MRASRMLYCRRDGSTLSSLFRCCCLLWWMVTSLTILLPNRKLYFSVMGFSATTKTGGGVFVRPIKEANDVNEGGSTTMTKKRRIQIDKTIQDHHHHHHHRYARSSSTTTSIASIDSPVRIRTDLMNELKPSTQENVELFNGEASTQIVEDDVAEEKETNSDLKQRQQEEQEEERRQRIIDLEDKLKSTKEEATQRIMEVANLVGEEKEEGLKIRIEEGTYYRQFRKVRRTIFDKKAKIPQHHYVPVAVFAQSMLMMEHRLEAEKMAFAHAKEVARLKEAVASSSSSSQGDDDTRLEDRRQSMMEELMEDYPEHEQTILEAMRLLSSPENKKSQEENNQETSTATSKSDVGSNDIHPTDATNVSPPTPPSPAKKTVILQSNEERMGIDKGLNRFRIG